MIWLVRMAIAGAALMLGLTDPNNQSSAQEPTVRVRGAIDAIDGHTLQLKTRTGDHLTVQLPETVKIVRDCAQFHRGCSPRGFYRYHCRAAAGRRLASARMHIFPESMRGTGEGHRAWDLSPSSTMTNGTVGQSVSRVEGNVLTISYKAGEKVVLVTPETSIVRYTQGDPGDLQPGAKVFISAAIKQPDGSFRTERVNVGRDGITPPM